ncbi:hypothetical protein HDV05_001178 [Chytridiales sp. JEL 0842]|nr:hypothetical protein HDV05_001178 [Chytridiales sp. JEL 0842]
MTDANAIAKSFVDFYYNTFDTDRRQLAPLYRDVSMLTYESSQIMGAAAIVEKLAVITMVDAQPSHPSNGSVLITVMGQLAFDDEPNPMNFMQTFHLYPAEGSYFVYNDIFRLIRTVEFAYGTPYLLSLGLSKPLLALVWLAGPLSGLIIQPVIGAYSDRCSSALGRRRPFIIVGALLMLLSTILIAYAPNLSTFFFHIPPHAPPPQSPTILLAVIGFYMLDFSINAVQASARSLIVDSVPLAQQNEANLWASRMAGLGNVLGYTAGFVDLTRLFGGKEEGWWGALWGTQLKMLCFVANVVLFGTLGCACLSVKEKRYVAPDQGEARRGLQGERAGSWMKFVEGWMEPLAGIWRAWRHLPGPVKDVCDVQFWSWLGWFPFLFYASTWVGEHTPVTSPEDTTDPRTRSGSFALLLMSLVALLTNMLAPLFTSHKSTPTPTSSNKPTHPFFHKLLSLPGLWSASIFFFAGALSITYLATNLWAATFVVGLCGLPWGVVQWIPFTLLGECISLFSSEGAGGTTTTPNEEEEEDLSGRNGSGGGYESLPAREEDEEETLFSGYDEQHLRTRRTPGGDGGTRNGLDAGVILGIHNVYIVLPQFVATFVTSLIFAGLEYLGVGDAFGWCLRAGVLAEVVAGGLAWGVRETMAQPPTPTLHSLSRAASYAVIASTSPHILPYLLSAPLWLPLMLLMSPLIVFGVETPVVAYAVAIYLYLTMAQPHPSTTSATSGVKARPKITLDPWRVYKLNVAFWAIVENIAYHPSNPSLKLDIYIPTVAEIDQHQHQHEPDIIVFIHGGSWSSGSKTIYGPLAHTLSSGGGYIVVVPSYTLYPRASKPEVMLNDIERCLEWVQRQGPKWWGKGKIAAEGGGGSRGNVHLVGHSSGGHLCALGPIKAALGALENGGDLGPWKCVKGVVGLSAVYDINLHKQFEAGRGLEEVSAMSRLMGQTRESFALYSPSKLLESLSAENRQRIRAYLPPQWLLIHGDVDATVPLIQSQDLYRVLKHDLGAMHTKADLISSFTKKGKTIESQEAAPSTSTVGHRAGQLKVRLKVYAKVDHSRPVVELMMPGSDYAVSFLRELRAHTREAGGVLL